MLNAFRKTQAYRKRRIQLLYFFLCQAPDFFNQPGFIQRSNLFQKDNGRLFQPTLLRHYANMGGQVRFGFAGSDRSHDHRRRKPVALIVLHNDNGPYAPLFAANHRRELCQIDFTSLNHLVHLRLLFCRYTT